MKCELRGCDARVAHAEHYYKRVRGWCVRHTPWSGHFEHCGDMCVASAAPTSVCSGCGCAEQHKPAAKHSIPLCYDCFHVGTGDVVEYGEHAGACVSVGMRALAGRKIQ